MNIRDLPEWPAFEAAAQHTLGQAVPAPADITRLTDALVALLTAIGNLTVKAALESWKHPPGEDAQ